MLANFIHISHTGNLGTMLALCMFGILLSYMIYTLIKGKWRDPVSIPGPLAGRLTSYYRIWLLLWGDAPLKYAQLHLKYGPIVRTGPNHVSIATSSLIPVIYDSKHLFRKVCQVFCIIRLYILCKVLLRISATRTWNADGFLVNLL